MRTEVHVHGYLELVEGVARRQVESALRPLLDYLDLDQLSELKSLEPDQPGFVFDDRNWALEMCCTLEVGRKFYTALESAMQEIGRLVENACAIEVITYHEDGRDETQLIFVGPTPAAIRDAQRRQMLADVGGLLSRHFNEQAVNQVLALVGELFRHEGNANTDSTASEAEELSPKTPQDRRRLH